MSALDRSESEYVSVLTSDAAFDWLPGPPHNIHVFASKQVIDGSGAHNGDTILFFVQRETPMVKIACSEESGQYALQGTYKGFSVEQDIGFIDCPDTHEYFDGCVYVSKEVILAAKDPMPGLVRFNGVVYGGALWARDMELESSQKNVEQEKDALKEEEQQEEQSTAQEAEPELQQEQQEELQEERQRRLRFTSQGKTVATGQTFWGTVKSLGPTFGFIYCQAIWDAYHKDVFTPANKLEQRKVGDQVRFELGLRVAQRPQPQAVKVWYLGDGGEVGDEEENHTRKVARLDRLGPSHFDSSQLQQRPSFPRA